MLERILITGAAGALGAHLRTQIAHLAKSLRVSDRHDLGKAAANFGVAPDEPPAPDVRGKGEIRHALVLGSIIVPSVVTQLSRKKWWRDPTVHPCDKPGALGVPRRRLARRQLRR